MNIGIQLQFDIGDLEAIKKNHNHDCGECFTQLLSDWLKRSSPTPSWKALIDALTSSAIGIRVNFKPDSPGCYITIMLGN